MKMRWLLFLVMLVVLPAAVEAKFHDGSFASCGGCHNQMKEDQAWTPSDICLHCHTKEVAVLTADGSGVTPGGDFYWLGRTYAAAESADNGDQHGHNIFSHQHSLRTDRTLAEAPGGSYRARSLGCTSCHDPHAREGTYRLLGTVGYKGGIDQAGFEFRHPAPDASSPAEVLVVGESDQAHNDYLAGMAEWCTNCHEALISLHQHPSGANARLGKLAATYGQRAPGGYDWIVPVEAAGGGVSEGSNVMCLTCHRAHSSPFASSGRWDFKVTFLRDSPALAGVDRSKVYAGTDALTRYGEYQRSLCLTCH